ncbi:MAG: pitrilysin family protein [Verrucomicrobiota bacterium]
MEYPFTQATVETLPNGLVLICDPDATAPVVSCQIWVETGSMHEGALAGAGLSHFLEHMVFKGTRDYDADTLAGKVQAAGGHWNAYTTFDRTVYYIDGPAASLPEFLKCLTGLVFFPTLPESAFELEKDVIRREIDMGLDDPDNAASRLLLQTAFRDDPRRLPVIGHRHLFDAIRHEDLREYHRTRYTTDRAFVVISGDFDPAPVRGTLMEMTTGCFPGAGVESLVPRDAAQLGPREARETFAIPVSRISMAWKSASLDHPDSAAFEILAAILGRGRASVLHRKLREERALALEISAWQWTMPGREGIFAISADAKPELRDELIQAIQSEIEELTLTLDDLAKAKRQILASQFGSLTTASGRASDLASNWHDARDLDFTRSHVANIDNVTLGDIDRVLATLRLERVILTVLDPMDTPVPRPQRTQRKTDAGMEVVTLANGLRAALVPDRRVPLIHFQATVRAGLPSENPATNGINQLLASSLPKGAAGRSAAEIALAMESLGASIHARSGNNAVLVSASGLAPDLHAIASTFADVVLAPDFPADAVAREKTSQEAVLRESLEEPLHQAFCSLRAALFHGSGYGLDPLGTLDSLPLLDRKTLTGHHARHFNAANTVLAVAGDFEPADVRDLLEERFAGMPSGAVWTPPPSATAPAGTMPVVRLPKKQAVIAIGFPGVSATDPDRHALAFLQEYVSDMAGPLFTRLREDLGLAYQVGATQFLGFDAGLFSFYIATAPEHADQARDEMLAEIAKIAAAGIPVDQIDQVRATVLSSHALQQQSSATIARMVSLDLLFDQSADGYQRLPEIYRALDSVAIQSAAARIFSGPPVIATVVPADASI